MRRSTRFLIVIWLVFCLVNVSIAQRGRYTKDRNNPGTTTTVAASNSSQAARTSADYICDGADDDAQINAAIVETAAIGGTVCLVDGDYYLGARVAIKSNVTLTGEDWGTILHFPDAATFHMIGNENATLGTRHATGNENITLRNMQIDCNVSGQLSATYRTVMFSTVKNLRIEDLFVHNSYTTGIHVEFCEKVRVTGNSVGYCGDDGIAINDETFAAVVANNHVYGMTKSEELGFTAGSTEISVDDVITGATSSAHAIVTKVTVNTGSWVGNDAAGVLETKDQYKSFTAAEDLEVSAAKVAETIDGDNNQSGYGIELQDGVHDITVVGNVIEDCAYSGGIIVTNHTTDAAPYNITISSNTIRNCYYGISAQGINAKKLENINIVNNVISYTVTSASSVLCLAAKLLKNCNISGNMINTSTKAMQAASTTIENTVISNNVFSCSAAANNALGGVEFYNTTMTNVSFNNNVFDNFGYVPLEFDSTATLANVHVKDNQFSGATHASGRCVEWDANVTSSGCILEGNQFSGTHATLVGATDDVIPANWTARNNNWDGGALDEQVLVQKKNTSGDALAAGDVVVLKAVAAGNEITTTTGQGDDKIFGIVAETIADTAYGDILVTGKTVYLKVDGTTDISIGDLLGSFTTAKIAMKAAAGDMAFAVACEAYTTNDSAGVIDAILITPRKM